eukprot:m51a1_g9266 hypothetical protein (330) ;mRNA; r:74289-75464
MCGRTAQRWFRPRLPSRLILRADILAQRAPALQTSHVLLGLTRDAEYLKEEGGELRVVFWSIAQCLVQSCAPVECASAVVVPGLERPAYTDSGNTVVTLSETESNVFFVSVDGGSGDRWLAMFESPLKSGMPCVPVRALVRTLVVPTGVDLERGSLCDSVVFPSTGSLYVLQRTAPGVVDKRAVDVQVLLGHKAKLLGAKLVDYELGFAGCSAMSGRAAAVVFAVMKTVALPKSFIMAYALFWDPCTASVQIEDLMSPLLGTRTERELSKAARAYSEAMWRTLAVTERLNEWRSPLVWSSKGAVSTGSSVKYFLHPMYPVAVVGYGIDS